MTARGTTPRRGILRRPSTLRRGNRTRRRARLPPPPRRPLAEEPGHAEEPVARPVRRYLWGDGKVAGDDRLVRMLEGDAVFVLEEDLAGGQVDALEEPADSHLARERAESGGPGSRRIEHHGGNSVARSRQGDPLRTLARCGVPRGREHERSGKRGGGQQRDGLLSLGASHASPRSRGRSWVPRLPAPSSAF